VRAVAVEDRRAALTRRTSRPPFRQAVGGDIVELGALHDRIIVRRHEKGEQNSGGTFIPDTGQEKPRRDAVIAAGSGTVADGGTCVALEVKAGDAILFGTYTSQAIKLDGEEPLIMREDEVLAVVETS
jgi:chaperonin GroES